MTRAVLARESQRVDGHSGRAFRRDMLGMPSPLTVAQVTASGSGLASPRLTEAQSHTQTTIAVHAEHIRMFHRRDMGLWAALRSTALV
jgi:hypothetical protein